MSNLNNKTLGIIHASHITIDAIKPYIAKYLPEVSVMHLCDDTIQRDNITSGAGVIPKRNYSKFVEYAHNLEEAGADMILLACSTFNYAAELARPLIDIPIAQIDRPMMEQVVRKGKKIGLLATLETTIPSSERLLHIAAREAGVEIDSRTVLCSEAFAAYSRGEIEVHNRILMNAIEELSEEVDCIVMAQLSMSVLAPYLKEGRVPVYNSGETAFVRIREMLERL